MQVIKHNTRLEVKFRYDHRLVSLVKSLDGRTYNPQSRSWFIPISGAGEALSKLSRAGFTIDPEALIVVKEDEARSKEAEALAELKEIELDTPINLYPFQKVCTAFMVKTGSCLNACGVGTGKTWMSLATTYKNKTRKNLIVAPKSLLLQWESECNRLLPEYKTFVVSGNKKQREEVYRKAASCERFYFLIMSYEQVRIDINFLSTI